MPSNKVLSAKGATSTIGEDDAGCKEPNVVDNPVGEKSNKQAHAQENRSGNRQVRLQSTVLYMQLMHAVHIASALVHLSQ